MPCLICGANQPQQPTGFGYNLFGNHRNLTTLPYFSTSVVGGSLAPDTFGGLSSGYSIAADLPFLTALGGNLTSRLASIATKPVAILRCWSLLVPELHHADGVGGVLAGAGRLPHRPAQQRHGVSRLHDQRLRLSGVNAGDRIGFFARITNANDGPDLFFLLAQPVPGPLVGAGLPGFLAAVMGLFGLSYWRRRRHA